MKTKVLVALALTVMLSVMMMATASAALPPGSWVKYSSNPVVPSGVPFGGSPFRPMVLWEGANAYTMYYSDQGTFTTVKRATTTDGGHNWSYTGDVLSPGSSGAWDDARVVTPTVLKEGANDYKMWYTGKNTASGVYAIGYATSTDGITWTKSGSNPVLTIGASGSWESQYVRAPSVVKDGSGTYHMFYEGTASWPVFEIGHATASLPQGPWTKDGLNPVLTGTSGQWDQNEVYSPSVVMNGSVFEMFYSGENGAKWLEGHASSANGTSWTKDANPILSPSASGWDSGDSNDYAGAVLDGSAWKLFYSGSGPSGGYQIGLATLQLSPQLSLDPGGTSVAAGSTQIVTINISNVTNLYGYEFVVTYDKTKVHAAGGGAFVNTFFDTTNSGSVPGGWNASCDDSAGQCKFAKTLLNPALPVSGSGPLATITFTGFAPGLADIAIASGDILTDRNAAQITHTDTAAFLTVYGSATIHGVVQLQGRDSAHLTAGTVTLYDVTGELPPVTVPFAAGTGIFTAPVRANDGGSTYTTIAAHSLYLSNQKGVTTSFTGFTVNPGDNLDAGTTTLKGGDANNDGKIDISDLSCTGSDFGTSNNSCTGGNSDINGDGTVNILDLVLEGGNYGLNTPQPWP